MARLIPTHPTFSIRTGRRRQGKARKTSTGGAKMITPA